MAILRVMRMIVVMVLALSGGSRAAECEWGARLCKPEHISTEACSLWIPVSWLNGAIEMQDLDPSVHAIMETLTDQPVDTHKNIFMGFPYYIRVDLLCGSKESSAKAMLDGLLTGLTPIVIVRFQESSHPTRLKLLRLEVELKTAPLSDSAPCGSKMCPFGWYAPMPIINDSVVYRLKVKSNGFGSQDVPEKSFTINVNGYVRTTEEGKTETSFGNEIQDLEDTLRVGSPSRPLWAAVDHTPVLLLPGIPGLKAVLMTATEFQFTSLIEVNIESHRSGSLSCPQVENSSMIQEAISTESSLFIRHNQQLYRYLGNYSLLPLKVPPSDAWEQVLRSVCVSGLVPASVPHRGREYFYVLGGGLQSGTLHRAEVYDGNMTFTELVDSFGHTACEFVTSLCCDMNRKSVKNCPSCQVRSAAQNAQQNVTDIILVELLPQQDHEHSYILLTLDGDFHMGDPLPKFIPNEQQESSSVELKLNGITFNPTSGILYIWGNTLICSYVLTWDVGQNFLFFRGFPLEQMIKYFILSFDGNFAFVTEEEELWWGQERTDSVFRLRPSQGWHVFSSLQALKGPHSYSDDYSTLTVFYDSSKELQEVMYTVDIGGKGSIVKRKLPVPEILYYSHFAQAPHQTQHLQSYSHFTFLSACPFDWDYFEDLPHQERFNRLKWYLASPPIVTPPSGLHTTQSLAVYQGLLYHLLLLHGQNIMDIRDPNESSISRMWKDEVAYKDLYSYLVYISESSSGVIVDMEGFSHPDLSTTSTLPDRVYLDRTASYSFSLYLRAQQLTQDPMGKGDLNHIRMSVEVSDYRYLHVTLSRHVMLNRGGVLYKVTVMDRGMFQGQVFPGEWLLSFSVLVRIVNSELRCFHQTDHGMILKGLQSVPVSIGCPPGNQLVFDVSTTLQESMHLNKRNFSCINPDPVTPCFYYDNLFYPFFLIQDLVLEKSRKFLGSFTFKVVGGGPYSRKNIREYSSEEVMRYNSINYSSEEALVWALEGFLEDSDSFNVTEEGFVIMNGTWNNGIRWLCKKNSPCGDVVAQDATAPHFYFIIEVSNRDMDTSTYCDYTFRFEILVHALHMSENRQLLSYLMALACILGVVVFYCILPQFLITAMQNLKCHGHTDESNAPAGTPVIQLLERRSE
ncbi:cation channel sperm-associated auxiliary subunit gamma-like [Xyrauchen texanus]|uniref:cation channel sperm-associated auxiliary subunit gamma-like n=1 Tax=Xyrauchen texanus TaxID=154827 RepID=UPI0022423F4A|nr:cation channel sperm-associated auxiliary subunit gamma-like [Xyrauchen texanus]XP_051950217.1 cation channel sperm-associated auxiliary subunit gamma-like [Xyrauchen texanus]